MASSQKLADFVAWTQKNITGDEKGQAQIFLDRLFQAFGQPGLLDVGGKTEFRIRKSTEDGGGISFADYVWKPIVLIEMKKRGANLATHLPQAFKYWERLCPDRPRYVVLCNFDEFRIYDFDQQIDAPVDVVTTKELPEAYGPLKFLEPGTPKPAFGVDRLQVTREAADKLAACFNKLVNRGIERPVAQHFILQMLVALFAEDIDLLPKYFVVQILEECTTPADAYDLIGGLFEAMNTPIDANGNPVAWPKADVIIGNPPFTGAKFLKPQRGPDYVNAVRRAYPDVPGMADYCVYWLRKAHDHLPACTTADPVAGRAGLVGTQNIRNNQSRVGGLDYIVRDGTIIEAVENQPWSGEAKVHVSIANWVKTQDAGLLPKKRRLWFKVQRPVGTARRARDYELSFRECDFINSALSDEVDVSAAKNLTCNIDPPLSFNGQMLGHKGFLLTAEQRAQIVTGDSKSAEVIFPYLNGREVLSGDGRPDRFVLDFGTRDQLEAAAFTRAFEWARTKVLPDRERKAKQGMDKDGKVRPHHKHFLARWWQLSFGRPELISLIEKLPRYLVISLVSKRPIFIFIDSAIRPSNLLQTFALADDYTFGILSSDVHWQWFKHKSSKLKSDYRYGEAVWNTFPWPQSPTGRQIEAVAEAGREVRRVRAEALKNIKGGLRALYRTLELPGANPLKDAHTALDSAVLAGYGFSANKDLLAQLLALNCEVAKRIEAGEQVTAPGIPQSCQSPKTLVTDDCIRP